MSPEGQNKLDTIRHELATVVKRAEKMKVDIGFKTAIGLFRVTTERLQIKLKDDG